MVGSNSKRKQRGSSLIEILVVIVIFTVGILGAVQVYPGGLAILRQNRSATVANALARAEMERLKANVDQLPEAIVALTYPQISPTLRETEIDLQRGPTDISPPDQVTGIDSLGVMFEGPGVGLGRWDWYSGANVMRQVIGEGRKVPAPRFIDGPGGTRFGGVLQLQFAPLFLEINNNDPVLGQFPFLVYGNDLVRRITDNDISGAFPLRQDYTYFVEDDGEFMAIPQGPARPDLAAGVFSRTYRVSARVQYTDAGGNLVARDLVRIIRLLPAAVGAQRAMVPFDLRALFNDPTGTLTAIRVEPDTIQVARIFDEVTAFLPEASIRTNPALLDDAVYQYQRLNDRLGIFLFHPQGAQYTERRAQGRLPLRARVDYNVLDWRNIRDDFRIRANAPFQQKLILDSLKVQGNDNVDSRPYTGLGFTVPDGTGGNVERDFLLIDQDTGAIIQPNGYRIDKSAGLVTFLDVDNNAANGLSQDVIIAGAPNATVRIPDFRNRAVRAVYQAVGEYAVQPIKPVTRYRPTFSSTLGFGQCYVGGTDINAPASLPSRLYFPLSDVGRKVVIGELWFTNTSGAVASLIEQEFVIRAPGPTDWNRYAFIDIREKDANAVAFDFSNGYAVRNVRGASVGVRVLWNPTFFRLSNDTDANMTELGKWLSQMRRVTTETFLMKGAEE